MSEYFYDVTENQVVKTEDAKKHFEKYFKAEYTDFSDFLDSVYVPYVWVDNYETEEK